MIPNIVVDNLVQRHLHARALHGDHEWGVGGSKRKEWDRRLRDLKIECAVRSKINNPPRKHTFRPRGLHSDSDDVVLLNWTAFLHDPA